MRSPFFGQTFLDWKRAEELFSPELLNRMTLKPMGRAVKASILSLGVALGVSACSNDYTVSYV